MKLSLIISGVDVKQLFHDCEGVDINGIHFDSRAVQKGSLFVAIKGEQGDGHDYIDMAVQRGACIVVGEYFGENLLLRFPKVGFLKVDCAREALALMACNYYNHPSAKMQLVGVTGTNGKTTIATLMFRLFTALGYRCGLISTIENRVADVVYATSHTTPDPLSLNNLLSEMNKDGVTHCFMEVSSHAVSQQRIAGLSFSGGIFTNLTHEHLDYHRDFKSYIYAKKRYFDLLPKSAWALSNMDDVNGSVILQNCIAEHHFYSLKNDTDFKGKIIENTLDGLLLDVNRSQVWFQLAGVFNAYNLLAVYGAACLMGEVFEEVLVQMSLLTPAEGRFDRLKLESGTTAIIDYAHTPDALSNVLQTVLACRDEAQQLITVVGAGGNRDKSKRPEMGRVAARYSDKVILTSDNPRFESPEAIIQDLLSEIDEEGRRKVVEIVSRRDAIKTAVLMASPNDIILLAGKGHEKYQDISGQKIPFDDKMVLLGNQ